jgi:hypothetical protein
MRFRPPPFGQRLINYKNFYNNLNNKSSISLSSNKNVLKTNSRINSQSPFYFSNLSDNALQLIQSRLFPVTETSTLPTNYNYNVAPSAQIRCYGCQTASKDCTVPCHYPQRCFIRASNLNTLNSKFK